MGTRLLFILFIFCVPGAFAQKTRSQRCAPAASPKAVYTPQAMSYADMEFGGRKAFVRTYDGRLDNYYSFISIPMPYACFSYSRNIYRRLEFYSGFDVALIRPGVKFDYHEDGNKIIEKVYQGVAQARVQCGISLNLQPGLKVTLAPALVISSNWDYNTAGNYTLETTSVSDFTYEWNHDEYFDKLLPGADFKLEYQVARNFFIDFSLLADLDSAIPFDGKIEMDFTNGNSESYVIKASPYLVTAGFGISYRFLQRGGYY